jgi:phenylacetate-CoA ligase
VLTTDFPKTKLPIYHRAIDWDSFFHDYPVPDVFAETVYQWPIGRVRDLQNERFVKLVEDGWRNPFYRRRWEAAGLRPSDIRGLEDITKLPLFTSDDIKDNQQQYPPSGDIHGVRMTDLRTTPLKLQTSGGTTGKPRATLFGPVEWEMCALTAARGIYIQGGRAGDIMQIPITCYLATMGWGYYKACHDYLGILPLTTGAGNVTRSRRQLEIAFEWSTNIWVSFPEYLTQLAKVCEEEMKQEIRKLNTKFLITYLGPDTDGILRRQLEESWDCPVYDNYGTHEMGTGAFECQEKNGLHFMEDCMYFEVVDIETGKPVKTGETGNLVVTIFHRRIPPIIRFNLRDLSRIISEGTCRCGSTFRRMDHFLGRSDDMVKLRGVNLYPMVCLSAIKSDSRTTGEWICVADRFERDGVLRDEMTVRVETRRDAGDLKGLHEYLEKRLQNDLGVKVDVELVEEGSLAELTGFSRESKPKRLLDRRYRRG